MTILLHLLLVLAVPPLLIGAIAKTKAIAGGRSGPHLLQAYFDIAKLFRKGTVISGTTTKVFFAGPALAVAVPLLASAMLPLASRAPVAFTGDAILFVYLFALSRFFTTAAALDTGSAFEGMGASREVTFAALAEPALFLGLLALARLSGALSLEAMLEVRSDAWRESTAALVLIVASWAIVLLAETSRVPFDDPNTHLELTMVHEAMVLDHGGPPLGAIVWGSALKLFVFTALVAHVVLPPLGSPLVDAAATLLAVLLIAIVIGVVESAMARLRLARIPQLLVTASLIAGFAVVLVLR